MEKGFIPLAPLVKIFQEELPCLKVHWNWFENYSWNLACYHQKAAAVTHTYQHGQLPLHFYVEVEAT